jgi:hypothetical protein
MTHRQILAISVAVAVVVNTVKAVLLKRLRWDALGDDLKGGVGAIVVFDCEVLKLTAVQQHILGEASRRILRWRCEHQPANSCLIP